MDAFLYCTLMEINNHVQIQSQIRVNMETLLATDS